MKKVVCTATSFGYGPIGKLLSICKFLKKKEIELILIADELALQTRPSTLNALSKQFDIVEKRCSPATIPEYLL